MINWVVDSGLKFVRLIVAGALGFLGIALVQLHSSSVDIYPEFKAPAVQIQAEALGLSAQEVEQLITVPLEQDLLNGIPWLEHISSRSMPGLSAIDLQFEPGTDLQAARQMTQERMTQAKALPNVGTPPMMVQPTSATSRVAMVSMSSESTTLMQMSVLARWQIRPRLMSIPGVAQVSVWGLRDRQLQVQVDPARLRSSKVSLTQLIESTGNALWVSPLSFVEASTPGTGGFVETPNQRLGVQHIQPISTSRQLADVAVVGARTPALRIGDVANVTEDHQPLIGDAAPNGTTGLVLVVERFPGADTAQVTRDVEDALEAMAPGLSGITLDTHLFRPASYLATALTNLGWAGLVAALLALGALGALLMSWRALLVPAVAVPLSLVSATWVLHLRGETLTTMTLLGLAAATAVVVDDVVGDLAQIRRGVVGWGQGSRAGIAEVVAARRGPLLVAAVIALLAMVPVLSTTGVVEAFVRPLALSYVLAIGTSLVVALLITPVLALMLLRGVRQPRPGPLDRWMRRCAERISTSVVVRPVWVMLVAALVASAGALVAGLAPVGPLLPTLADRNVLVRVAGMSGTSLTEMSRITSVLAEELRNAPGVASVGAHVGRAIAADEIVDVNAGEVWLTVADDASYDETMARVREISSGYPGLRTSVGTYAEDQVATADHKVGDELVVRVYGHDFATLRRTANEVSSVLSTVTGVLAPRVEPQVSEPTVEIEVDLPAAQRHGLRPGDVRREASTLVSGLTVGSLYEQQKIFDVVVWGGPATRHSVSDLRALTIDTPGGGHVRLGDVAKVRIAPNPVSVSHHNVSRSIDVTAVVNGRSAPDVAHEVSSRLRGVALPYEYHAEVLTGAADRQAAQRHMGLIVAVVALLSFLILQAATGSWGLAAALLVTTPLAGAGGVLVAPVVGGVGSLGVLVALGALFLLALRQALVFVRRAQMLGATAGTGPRDATRAALREAAPSVVGVAVVLALLLTPPAVMGPVAGLELLHPFAVSMLAGLITATAVSLIAVPTFYLAVAGRNAAPPTVRSAPESQPEVEL